MEATRGRHGARSCGQHGDGPGHEYDFRADRRGSARARLRADRNHAAGHGACAQQRAHRGFAHHDDCGQACGVGGARNSRLAARKRTSCRLDTSAEDFSRACARSTSKHLARCKSLVKYEHPRDLHWDDAEVSAATPTAPMRGRFMWRKFPSICERPKCASRILSRCRKWAR